MSRFLRVLCVFALVFSTVGPVSAATIGSPSLLAQNAPAATGTVSGNVRDGSGAPIANAIVTLQGPAKLSSQTDANGGFAFNNVPPGVYGFLSRKTGYNTATESSIVVLSGQSQTLTVVMNAATLSSLRTIATVRSSGRGTFNTSPASVSVITSQTIADQGQVQIMKVLNETPGIVASLPQSSANAASPGAITFPNIRGALSFETASLIDGHPISVGTFGDYVTTFLNPFVLQNVEIVKGPGADAPEVNYALGGTVNFRSKDPTYSPTGLLQIGGDSRGSAIGNLGISDTVGRVGYVIALGYNDLETALAGSHTFISAQSPQQGILNYNGSTGTAVGFNDAFPTPIVPGTVSGVENSYNLVACCQTLNSLYQNQSELLKLRYKLSNVTSATFTYLGSQTTTNQAANTSDITPSTFSMTPSQAAGYNGSIPNGTGLDIGFIRTPEIEHNNEPILEGEIRSSVGNNTVLARYYGAGIHRLVDQGSGPTVPTVLPFQLYGYDTATKKNYNGQTVPLAFYDYFHQAENDALRGYSFEFDHPFGQDNVLSLAYDSTHSATTSYSIFDIGTPSAGQKLNAANIKTAQSISLPTGSTQDFGTLLARAFFQLGPKTNLTFSNYLNTYRSTYPVSCKSGCSFDGTGYTFGTTTRTHYDPRLSVEFRPTQQLALRFAAGSGIAPPYLALLASSTQPISYNAKTGIASERVNSGTLSPETAFGYNFGGDYRFADGATVLSGDVYLENIFNHFVNTTYTSGQNCPAVDPVTGGATGCPANTPLLYTSNINVSNTRLQGIELALRRAPAIGFGYTIQGALQKGYPYNLPQYFYCSTPGPGCTQNTNLAVVPNQNFYGGGIGNGVNGLSNQNLPYAQGYGELNFRTLRGMYGNVGLTYFGKNNSLNRPPFTVLSATLRVPINHGLALQISGDNLTNAYSAIFPNFGGGVPIQLVNGKLAATQANVLGPSVVRFTLTKTFGP
ncbi:MAG: TonB-dependent receptor [Candidatus Eremiobacteraeota bacterium]|nr:TonB-dependent receptor [Candidatus Eremiobacteraeota bacterium]